VRHISDSPNLERFRRSSAVRRSGDIGEYSAVGNFLPDANEKARKTAMRFERLSRVNGQ
jgi:hypothetical protein